MIRLGNYSLNSSANFYLGGAYAVNFTCDAGLYLQNSIAMGVKAHSILLRDCEEGWAIYGGLIERNREGSSAAIRHLLAELADVAAEWKKCFLSNKHLFCSSEIHLTEIVEYCDLREKSIELRRKINRKWLEFSNVVEVQSERENSPLCFLDHYEGYMDTRFLEQDFVKIRINRYNHFREISEQKWRIYKDSIEGRYEGASVAMINLFNELDHILSLWYELDDVLAACEYRWIEWPLHFEWHDDVAPRSEEMDKIDGILARIEGEIVYNYEMNIAPLKSDEDEYEDFKRFCAVAKIREKFSSLEARSRAVVLGFIGKWDEFAGAINAQDERNRNHLRPAS